RILSMIARTLALFVFLFVPFYLKSEEKTTQIQLSLKAIRPEMQKIFSEHLTQKKMTPDLMGKALMHYVNQFDPHHVYLLQDEVAPFLDLSTIALARLVDAYEQDNFTIFEKLNKVIQAAIVKMRQFRRSMVVDVQRFSDLAMQPLPNIPEESAG